jgi:methylthioribose-1-phosphate isomerase
MRTIEWENGVVTTVDQTKLPLKTVILTMSSCKEVCKAIKTMQIRGAPLLGAAAGYGLALTAFHSKAKKKHQLIKELDASAHLLRQTRPTAVNLFWAIERILEKAKKTTGDTNTVAEIVVKEAQKIALEDVQTSRKIGENGAVLIDENDTVLTHCNAGRLATVDYGTALAVIRAAWTGGKKIKVIATETRPLLQGARLTAYELFSDGIPVTLVTDSMVGYVMAESLVNKIIVGADRIVKDGVINKIGTYQISVLAVKHRIPFYVAAPQSTFDMNQLAENIVIEQRDAREVMEFAGTQITPSGISVLNPAFDVTPMKNVTAIISEKGIIYPSTDLKPQQIERHLS